MSNFLMTGAEIPTKERCEGNMCHNSQRLEIERLKRDLKWSQFRSSDKSEQEKPDA